MSETPPQRLPSEQALSGVDANVPHSARVWNYWLGGKDYYAVDREYGDRVREQFPGIVDIARADRAFLARAVRFLVTEIGIRQFLDVGTGLPTADNTHEIAQRLAPECRIVYVDNDPLVLTHARALLTSHPDGVTDYLDADLHEPSRILDSAASTLDFTQPVALMLLGVLGHVPTHAQARDIVRQLMDALPAGSYLAVHEDADTDPIYVAALRSYNSSGAVPYHLRPPEDIAAYLDPVELVAPGLVPSPQWRPDDTSPDLPTEIAARAAVGRKP